MTPAERHERARRGVEATLDRYSPWVEHGPHFDTSEDSDLLADDRRCRDVSISDLVGMQFVVSVDLLARAHEMIYFSESRSVSGPATLLRTAIETAATALWVIEPDTSDDRVARTLRWHHADYVDAATHSFDTGDAMKEARQEIGDTFRALAVEAEVDPDIFGDRLTTTGVLRELESDGQVGLLGTWRLASGFAHGRPWAHVAFTERTDTGVVLPNGSNRYRWEPDDNVQGLFLVTVANLVTDLAGRWEHIAAA